MKLGPKQQKWIDALKSGQYEQTVGTLERSGKYCCLGLLCKVAEDDGVTVIRNDTTGDIKGSYLSSQSAVMDYVKIKTDNGLFIPEGAENSIALSELNDDQEQDFCGIADTIEANAEYIFMEPV